MPVPVGSSYYAEFTTTNPTTGAAQNGDSLPVATATHNGADDASFSLTVTNLATGRYKITGTVPGGYSSGDYVQVSVAATVATVAGVGVVDNFVIGPAALSANVTQWNGSNVATPNVAGVPIVDVGDWLGHAVTVDTNNAPNVSAKYWAGSAITATSIPVATAAGASGGLMISGANTGPWSVSSGVTFTNTSGAGLTCICSSGNGAGLSCQGGGAQAGLNTVGGSSGAPGMRVSGSLPGNNPGLLAVGTGTAGAVDVGSGGIAGYLSGSVGSVTAAVTISTAQLLGAPRDISAVADGSITVGDAYWAAIGAGAGQADASSGTSETIKTPSTGTLLRTFTLTAVAGSPASYITKRI
jgi:hypothetical protein